MPITIRPTTHPPRKWEQYIATTADELLRCSCENEHSRSKRILQSSFDDIGTSGRQVSPSSNGLVYAAYHAYAHHHHLRLRPEDVWLAILAQLSFYINANAEAVRSSFVSHKGQKELEVTAYGNIHTADFGRMAVQMTDKMDEYLVDKGLRAWVLPDFSTTNTNDTVTAAVLMMGAMQKYFTYTMSLVCGIPSVTLLGEKDDWVKIQQRLDRFDAWGGEAVEFAGRLKTVLRYFLRTFDEPDHPEVHEFWSKIAHHEGGGSGPVYLSGWITAFCCWNPEGGRPSSSDAGSKQAVCHIDDTTFSAVDMMQIPSAYVSVPVTVNDNGIKYKTEMVAGVVGITASSSGELLDKCPSHNYNLDGWLQTFEAQVGEKTGLDSIQPVSGWWMWSGSVISVANGCAQKPSVVHK